VGEERTLTRSIPPFLVTSCQNITSKRSTSMQNFSGNKVSRKGEKGEEERRKRKGEE